MPVGYYFDHVKDELMWEDHLDFECLSGTIPWLGVLGYMKKKKKKGK